MATILTSTHDTQLTNAIGSVDTIRTGVLDIAVEMATGYPEGGTEVQYPAMARQAVQVGQALTRALEEMATFQRMGDDPVEILKGQI